MKILGIDAATKACGVAIVDEQGVLAENWLNIGKTHSQRLLPLLDSLLKNSGITWTDIQGIAVTVGPGSFTGLRIGLATVQGLAQVLKLPVVGVVSLDALVENLPGVPHFLCPMLDARKNEVYTALYRYEAGRMTRLSPYQAVAPEKLVLELMDLGEKVTFLGEGAPVYQEMIIDRMKERAAFAPPSHNLLRGAQVALIGLQKFQRGLGSNLFEIKPFYLRPSEAEVKWVQTHGDRC
ncbi:MAG: tRNA (adenosine(37)-N6)-threonylcarbamoyltransferase complex dimerization subunit type 1 TsaB [Dehalobacterium sp.]|jgi:tRNA threonylcarbamoyladenosine biosynthesis protein TsaB